MSEHTNNKYRDPVCKMTTENQDEFVAYDYQGDTYYFCSDHCLAKFKENPETYSAVEIEGHRHGKKEGHTDLRKSPAIEDSEEKRNSASDRHIYTCPMHPEVEQEGPGSCPKCGMALEPRDISADADEENPEYVDMKKRFIIGAILTIPLVLIAMRDMIPGSQLIEKFASSGTLAWWEFILATPVVLWAGWPFYIRGVQSVINKNLNMFTLIGLGVSVAYIYSLVALLFPGVFPAAMRGGRKEQWGSILRRPQLLLL